MAGNERTSTQGFLRLESHFLFRHRFCRVARGNEKGHVETLVGYSHEQGLIKRRIPLDELFLSVSQGSGRGGELTF